MNGINKSVLVIDTPSSCVTCPLSFYTEMYSEHQCRGTEGINGYSRTISEYGEGAEKPDWCPLSSLPERINLCQYVENGALDMDGILNYQYAQGYNDCISEIMEGKE